MRMRDDVSDRLVEGFRCSSSVWVSTIKKQFKRHRWVKYASRPLLLSAIFIFMDYLNIIIAAWSFIYVFIATSEEYVTSSTS